MPRSSRHKSARSHKHGSKDGRDRSDSEDERIPKERKMKVEEPPAASSKGSREVDLEKRKAPVKDLIGSSNGDASGEKKRKDRSDDSFVSDRWAGGGEDDQTVGKKTKGEGSEAVDSDKVAKPNAPAVDVKARSSRKGEVLAEMNEDSASRSESAKRRLEKESSRRESGSSQHREAKDREREHLKDAKEKEREYLKDAKEEDAKEEREYSKDAKEKEREYPKDAKYREIDHPKDAKDRERDQLKDGKERDRHYTKDVKERGRDQSRDEKDRDRDTPLKDSKERDRDYSKDSKERDRDYSKDSKDREKDYPKNGKDRDRDHHKDTKERVRGYTKDTKDRDKDPPKDANELDREHFKDAKERNREQPKDAKDRDREQTKDAKERDREHPKDAKERDRDYPNDTRERDRDYSKDAKEREREYYKDTKEREREYYKDTKERERGYIMDIKDRERDYGKNGNERDKERGLERDKKVQDSRYERSDDVGSRKQVSKNNSSQDEHPLKKDVENSDGKRQGDLRTTEVEKELDRRSSRRRDSSGDRFLGDGRDGDERRVVSRDYPAKNAESHRDEKYRDKYRDDVDRVQKHHDERGRDEHFSRDHGSNRSDNKHFRDDSRISDNRYKKNKIQDNEHDASPYVDDHGTKLKDNRGRKRFSDQIDEHSEFTPRNAKELREDTERHASSLGKLDTYTDRNRLDYAIADKTDSSLGSNRPKTSPHSGNYAANEQSRSSSKQAGLSCRRSDETLRSNTDSRGEHATGVHERISDSRSLEKIKTRDVGRSDGLVDTSSIHYDRATKSEAHTLPLPLVGKSLSDRRLSDRTADRTDARRNLDIDGQRSINMKDGRSFSNIRDRDRAFPLEKSISGDLSHADMPKKEAVPVGLASFNRPGYFSGNSPSRIPPLHPRHGIDSSSGHGSYEDDSKVGERKPYSRYRRSVEPTIGRGQGNAWKNAPSWPSPVANGFIPLPTGPPHSGFHTSVHQFPGPSLFGVRPSMDLNHTGLQYRMHEGPDRFSGHVRPFGWHNPVDDCPPHLQVWDGSSSVFGDESHVYGRSQWDMNKHLIGNRGWEMRADVWKGQNGNMNMEIPASQESEYPPHAFSDETWAGKTVHNERAQSEQRPADSSEIKSFNEKSQAKTTETSQKCIIEKIPESKTPIVSRTSNTPSYDDSVRYCCNYLSNIDISSELSTQDLYNQCASLLAAGNTTSIYSADKREHRKDYKSEATVAAKGTNKILSPLFPKITDGVFQRAMSLYKKQNEGRKAMYSVSPSIYVEEKESLEGSGQPKEVDNQMSSVNTSVLEIMKPADNRTSTDVSLANTDSTGYMESTATIDTVAFSAENPKEQQSDSITDDVHFVEGLQSCEALLPECRVNLSRIHLSPGSTH